MLQFATLPVSKLVHKLQIFCDRPPVRISKNVVVSFILDSKSIFDKCGMPLA